MTPPTGFRARFFCGLLGLCNVLHAAPPERIYLSGRGPQDAVDWEFFCSEGRNSGIWTTIPVPSCWETEGFGTFDYGLTHRRGGGDRKPPLAAETGHYRTRFTTAPDWTGQSVRLVFDGVLTDAEVRVNGHTAGPRHEGGYYRFHYDITDLLVPDGDNLLEVTVHKVSANESVNAAERRGDFWTFGGIFRPVWLEVRPPQHITRTAIDARADGTFRAEVHVSRPLAPGTVLETRIHDADGNVLQTADSAADTAADDTRLLVTLAVDQPATWSAETPVLHHATFRLTHSDGTAHETTTRFGFRTIELRPADGLYVNGVKVKLRGVNRHCFRPDSGRTLSPEQSRADVELLRSLNANAVRCAHYPPDEAFLEACDELGLYVLDELTGWHDAYDTPTGARLIGQMVRRDVNHPSVILWNNGNERGWNDANDGEFARWDPQGRPVLHPWAEFGGIDTGHYPNYATLADKAIGPTLYMPTEFLHGQFDGGSAAGLADFWKQLQHHPAAIGGFLWVLADEGVRRPDWNGELDTAGDMAPDGIVGPHHETDGHAAALRAIWSPLQISAPANLRDPWTLSNRHNHIDTSGFQLQWSALRHPAPPATTATSVPLASRTETSPVVAAGASVDWQPNLPENWRDAHTLRLTVLRPDGSVLTHGSWPVSSPTPPVFNPTHAMTPIVTTQGEALVVTLGDHRVEFDWVTGQLRGIRQRGRRLGPANGPRLEAWQQEGDRRAPLVDTQALAGLDASVDAHVATVIARYKNGFQSVVWRLQANPHELRLELNYSINVPGHSDAAGLRFDWLETGHLPARWLGQGPHAIWRNRLPGGTRDVHPIDDTNRAGYHGDWTWLRVDAPSGPVELWNLSGPASFCLDTAHPPAPTLTQLPSPGFSLMHVTPAIGTKFHRPADLGPQSQPVRLRGPQPGALVFRLLAQP